MATTKVWTGAAGNNEFNNLANYNEATAFANGDTLIFSSGSIDASAGLSHAYTGVIIKVTSGYTGKLGSASAGIAPTSCASVEYAGRGAYMKINSTITKLVAKLSPSTEVFIAGGTTTNAYVSGNGKITKESGATVTNIRLSNGAIYEAQGTNAHTIIRSSGTVISTSNVGTYTGLGGDRLTVKGTATATALIFSSSTICNYQSSGTISELEGTAGARFIVEQSETGTGTLTISQIYSHPGFSFDRYPVGVAVTVTAEQPVGGV